VAIEEKKVEKREREREREKAFFYFLQRAFKKELKSLEHE